MQSVICKLRSTEQQSNEFDEAEYFSDDNVLVATLRSPIPCVESEHSLVCAQEFIEFTFKHLNP